MPDEHFDSFWSHVDDCLQPGGRVFFFDDNHRAEDELVEGRNSPIVQRRTSDGTPFRIIKIRTLPPDTPPYTDKYTVGRLPLPWFPRALRQLHLDELPQLFLVVLGRMSLVGPRPEIAPLIPLMPRGLQVSREAFRPGCTGLWQVSVAANGLIAEAPQYDRFYAAHARLSLDVFILFRTAIQLFRPSRRVSLSTMPSWAARGVACYASRALALDGFIHDLTAADQRAAIEPAGVAS